MRRHPCRARTYTYDDAGQLITVTAPDGTQTTFEYDDAGNRIARTDANGHTTTWSYDDDGNLAGRQSPTGQSWGYLFDGSGRLFEQTSAGGNATPDPDDGATTYRYDRAGRLTGITAGRGHRPARPR